MSTIKNCLTPYKIFLTLNGLPHIGPVTTRNLLNAFDNNPVAMFHAKPEAYREVPGVGRQVIDILMNWKEHFNLEKELVDLKTKQADFVSCTDDGYPPLLKEIYDPPVGLYCLDKYRPGKKTVAIIGSRRATLYGLKVAKQLGSQLASMGFCVASGMARGIDSAAHEGVLEANGRTVAVLECGLDIIYPPENAGLYNRIAETGAVMSEFRLGSRADKRSFPMRNRIVYGMSQAVIVVETNSNGGSMITARLAGEQGRQVFAVPGRIDQASSRGCHQLIRDGAVLLTRVDDLLEELSYLAQGEFAFGGADEVGEAVLPDNLSEKEQIIFKSLRGENPMSSDEICTRTSLAPHEVASSLMLLELKKVLVKRADGMFEAK